MKKVPRLTVDVIIEKNDKIVLIRRKNKPFEGKYALPGGFVEYGEKVEDAAVREAKEETSLEVKLKEILGVYSEEKRDPRFHSISVVFIASPLKGRIEAKSDAEEARWVKLEEINFRELAFDHAKILRDYLNYKKFGGTYWSSKS